MNLVDGVKWCPPGARLWKLLDAVVDLASVRRCSPGAVARAPVGALVPLYSTDQPVKSPFSAKQLTASVYAQRTLRILWYKWGFCGDSCAP